MRYRHAAALLLLSAFVVGAAGAQTDALPAHRFFHVQLDRSASATPTFGRLLLFAVEAKAAEADFQRRAAGEAAELIAGAKTLGDIPYIAHAVSDGPAAYLPVLADALKARWQGVAVLASAEAGKVALLCAVAPAFAKQIQAGKVIQAMAPLVGGKGGGRPELAQGGGTNPDGVPAALAKAEELVRAAGS